MNMALHQDATSAARFFFYDAKRSIIKYIRKKSKNIVVIRDLIFLVNIKVVKLYFFINLTLKECSK